MISFMNINFTQSIAELSQMIVVDSVKNPHVNINR